MAFTYDVTNEVGKVRLLITDTDSSHPIFQDDEINAFLALNDGVKRSAAAALDVIASNQTLILKVIRLLDISTDGSAVARAVREHANQLREEAEIADAAEEGGLFDYAEMVTNAFTARQRMINQILREDV
ncbi:MAG: hypothetical protein L0287_06185 [Anaerolineae bacterium]|nr:hypothetical protein [Anaerolineae bacterium]